MKVGIIGHATPSSGVSHMLGGMNDVAREAMSNELTSRRNLVTEIATRNKDNPTFKALRSLSSKEMKKMTKGFSVIYRYVEPLNFHLFEVGNRSPSATELKKIALIINSLTNSKPFAALDLEDVNTDYFRLTLATYIVLKNIISNVKAKRNDPSMSALIDVTSELGLRIYSLYIDNRQDHAPNSETVQFR